MPLTGQFNVPIELELTAVFFLAITGALLAIEERYDIVGVFVLALLTAVGGGLMRDILLLQKGTPLALQDARYLYVIALATLLCLIVGTHLNRLRLVFLLADALGLGMFAVVGAQRALGSGLPLAAAAFVGLANAVGGGVLRDLLTRKDVLLLKPGEFYVLAAVAGTVVFLGLAHIAGLRAADAALWSIGTTVVVRLAAVSFNWSTTAATPLLRQRSPETDRTRSG
jgi:uncharacterized membrane protein YeiH